MRIKDKLKKLSYKKKIFLGMIFTSIIPLVICVLGVLLSFRAFNDKKLSDDALTVLNISGGRLNDECDAVLGAVKSIANAPSTLRMLEDNDKADVYSVYRLMYSSVTSVRRHADFTLYDEEGRLKLYTGDRTIVRDALSLNWGILYELTKNPGIVTVRSGRIYNGSNKDVVLRLGRAVVNSDGEVKGYVIAEIRNESFYDIFRGIIPDNAGALYVLDDYNQIVYSSLDVDADEFKRAREAFFKDGSSSYTDEETYARFYYRGLYDYGVHVFYRQETRAYSSMSSNLGIIMVVASLTGLLVCLYVSHRFSRMFYRPIQRMSNGMKEIRDGNFQVEIEVDGDDELGRLSRVFNEMSAELTDNMTELVKREQELADANVKMMQAQLNPHFIYNTLETLKWIGKDNEVPEVATLSAGLADIMRASISSGQTVKLKKEVELVESYAAIQQIRFSDKFELLTDIPDELMDCEVPKLILQPVVENSIIHGFSTRSYGQVLISGYREDDRLILFVRDDGAGADDETINKLNNHEQLAKGSNIGFHNVDAIIRLHYGEEYGLSISKSEGGGTEVKYVLPFSQSGSGK